MKRNLLYSAGFLLTAVTVFSGCSDDDPSYHDLVPNIQELIINLDETPEGIVQIVRGSDSYKTTSSNEDVATTIAEGNKIKVTALKIDNTDLPIIDWIKMNTNVKVIADQLSELVLFNSAMIVYPGENKTANAYTGNRGYKVTANKESIVKAIVDEEGHIRIESLTPGNAAVIVTDKLNKNAEFSVKVIKEFVVDNSEEIVYLTVGEPLIIKILDGNGGYTCTNSGSAIYLRCMIVENGMDVIIEGLKRYRFSKTVTIKNQGRESISVNIVYIDDLHLEGLSYRYLITDSFSYQSVSAPTVGSITHLEGLNMSEIVIKGIGTCASGSAVQFTGNLAEGNKGDAILHEVTRNAADRRVKYPVEDCRTNKMEDGWYWVNFLKLNCAIHSCMITRQ